jgi:hypothetical protein
LATRDERHSGIEGPGAALPPSPSCGLTPDGRAALRQQGEIMMYRCTLCGWTVTLDDVELVREKERLCVCVRCYTRETGTWVPMPKPLIRSLVAILGEIE